MILLFFHYDNITVNFEQVLKVKLYQDKKLEMNPSKYSDRQNNKKKSSEKITFIDIINKLFSCLRITSFYFAGQLLSLLFESFETYKRFKFIIEFQYGRNQCWVRLLR